MPSAAQAFRSTPMVKVALWQITAARRARVLSACDHAVDRWVADGEAADLIEVAPLRRGP
jgi:hypothetical protein